jgi:hypothetical protein
MRLGFAAYDHGPANMFGGLNWHKVHFWIGLTTFLWSALAIVVAHVSGWSLQIQIEYVLVSAAVGVIVVLMISVKLISYQAGGTIAVKKFLMFSAYFIGATILGVMIYGEAFGWGKVLGIIGFGLTYILMEANLSRRAGLAK